jgi:hypothetical protein
VAETLELIGGAIVIGVAGSALMDVWSAVLRRRFGIPTLDYALLGRWIGHVAGGRVAHERIGAASAIPGERAIGWLAHYAIGITFALVLVGIWGRDWLATPTPGPALIVGIGTILAPWLVMQPAMGLGVAAARSPNPTAPRPRHLGSHTVYGICLYGAAIILAALR